MKRTAAAVCVCVVAVATQAGLNPGHFALDLVVSAATVAAEPSHDEQVREMKTKRLQEPLQDATKGFKLAVAGTAIHVFGAATAIWGISTLIREDMWGEVSGAGGALLVTGGMVAAFSPIVSCVGQTITRNSLTIHMGYSPIAMGWRYFSGGWIASALSIAAYVTAYAVPDTSGKTFRIFRLVGGILGCTAEASFFLSSFVPARYCHRSREEVRTQILSLRMLPMIDPVRKSVGMALGVAY